MALFQQENEYIIVLALIVSRHKYSRLVWPNYGISFLCWFLSMLMTNPRY